MPERIYGVVLAAGMSRRLGRPKQLLDLGGRPLVAHVVQRALAAGLDGVVVVTGHEREAVEAAVSAPGVTLAFNPEFASGQASSLIAGLDAVPTEADAIVVLLSDQPTIAIPTITAVVNARRETAAPIVMATYGAVRAHPTLIGRELFPELRAINGDQGAREVIRAHRRDVVTVDSGQSEPPADVDTEEAYAALLRSWSEDA
jgi:molybdenum cofactor cytidylyltransferase